MYLFLNIKSRKRPDIGRRFLGNILSFLHDHDSMRKVVQCLSSDEFVLDAHRYRAVAKLIF